MPSEGNLYLRGESAVGYELSAGFLGGALGLPGHLREEVHRRPPGEDRRVDVDIVKARVLEVDVEEIAHPGRLLNVIPANKLGDDLRRNAFLPLGRQGGGQPCHALRARNVAPFPERVTRLTA